MYPNLEPILDRLEDKKGQFIGECRRVIEWEVSSRGRSCLAIREIGVRVHFPAPDNYLKVVWSFRSNEYYHGHELESILTEPISNAVYSQYSEFLQEHRADIEEEVKRQIADSVDWSSVLEKMLFEKLHDKGIQKIRHRAVESFVHGSQAAFHSQLAQTTTAATSDAVTTGVGTAVGASIAHALSVAISHAIAIALVHVLLSVAFGAQDCGRPLAGAIVTAVLVHLVASKVTAGAASVILGPAAWLISGSIVIYKIITIPEKLGKELGDAMADMLQGEFRPWTETALKKCFKRMADPKEILQGIVMAEIDSYLPKILSEVEDMPNSPPLGYEDVGKDVENIVGYGEKGINQVIKSTITEDLHLMTLLDQLFANW